MDQLENYFAKSRTFLEDNIDPDSGLIEELLSKGILNQREKQKIKTKETYFDRNSFLLDLISQKKEINGLCDALTETRQNHIVNYLRTNGNFNPEFEDDWPLTTDKLEMLDTNEKNLFDILDLSELLNHLYSSHVINSRQREFIDSKPTSYDKNEVFLQYLRRFSIKNYKKTIECLKRSGQKHVAEVIENGGVVVKARSVCKNPNLEETIINSFAETLRGHGLSFEESSRILEGTLNIIALKEGQSIILYIYCKIQKDLIQLKKQLLNGQLRIKVQTFFSYLLSASQHRTMTTAYHQPLTEFRLTSGERIRNAELKEMTVTLSDEEYNRCMIYFDKSIKKISLSNDDENDDDNGDDENALQNQDPEERWRNAIKRHYKIIIDRMLSDFGLIDKLWESDFLRPTYSERKSINAEKRAQNKNEMILRICLSEKHKLQIFIEALRESNQKHLVKYLEYNGKYRKKFDGEWPLMEKEVLILRSNYEALTDLIKSWNLIGLLHATGVLNEKQKDFILSQSKQCDQNKALLDILIGSSLRSYWQTIRCLHMSNQSHIAKILESQGVVVRVDVTVEQKKQLSRSSNMTIIVTQINELLSVIYELENTCIFEELLRLKLVGAKQDHNVSLYFLCNQSSEVDCLETLANDGRLKEMIESLFNQLTLGLMNIKITPKWTTADFTRCREMMQAICAEVHISQLTPTTISNLPMEVLDIILQKSYAILIQRNSGNNDARDETVIQQLAEVNYCWFRRITKQRFKSSFWFHLSNMYKSKRRVLSFYRSSQQFVEENLIRLQANKKQLKSYDVLSDAKYAIIVRKSSVAKKRQSRKYDAKAFSLALDIRYEADQRAFVRYLNKSGLKIMVKVMENGGAAVRIPIKCRDANTIELRERLMKYLMSLKEERF